MTPPNEKIEMLCNVWRHTHNLTRMNPITETTPEETTPEEAQIEQMLERITQDPATIQFMHNMMSNMTSDTSPNRFDFWHGSGSNGISVPMVPVINWFAAMSHNPVYDIRVPMVHFATHFKPDLLVDENLAMDPECPVCLNDVNVSQGTMFQCGHHCCVSCVTQLAQQNCPLCRQVIRTITLQNEEARERTKVSKMSS